MCRCWWIKGGLKVGLKVAGDMRHSSDCSPSHIIILFMKHDLKLWSWYKKRRPGIIDIILTQLDIVQDSR